MSSVISPRGSVRVPSTSKRAMMRGFSGVGNGMVEEDGGNEANSKQ
jgi:hypothetical protein